jgi:hypothetical protein
MTWLLVMMHLVLHPGPQDDPRNFIPHVSDLQIIGTFYGEQECIKELHRIFREAEEAGDPAPKEVNIGCVPLKGRNI